MNSSSQPTKTIIKITTKEELKKEIILSDNFNNSIQVKNKEHICQDGTIYDYSEITDLSWMFHGCSSLTSIPLFDTSNVTNMSFIFHNCASLKNIPLLNTSNVTDMNGMFENCWELKTVPLFDTSNVINMSYMFSCCKSLTTVPLLDTSSVTNMSYMFNNCYSLITIPVFNTSNVTNISYMFSCSSLPKTEQVKLFCQKDKILLKSLEINPELFSEEKLNKLLKIT
jgi:surface protein